MRIRQTACLIALTASCCWLPVTLSWYTINTRQPLPLLGAGRTVRIAERLKNTLQRSRSSRVDWRLSRLEASSSRNNNNSNLPPLFMRGMLASLVLSLSLLLNPIQQSAAADVIMEPQKQGSSSSSALPDRRYWTLVNSGQALERIQANTNLMEFAVGTINTVYYDNTGGALFQPREFYQAWRAWLKTAGNSADNKHGNILETRSGVEQGLQWLVAQLHDPFSRYLTREELRAELGQSSHGFLGLGAIVVAPDEAKPFFGSNTAPVFAHLPPSLLLHNKNNNKQQLFLSAVQVSKLPVVTAVTPDSPAERAGLVVGDRILAVGTDSFLPYPMQAATKFVHKYSSAENYVGYPDVTIAKPVYASSFAINDDTNNMNNDAWFEEQQQRDIIVAYRPIRVRLTTVLTADAESFYSTYWHADKSDGRLVGGNAVVHYELLKSQNTIFDQQLSLSAEFAGEATTDRSVGYIRLTRFSRASTTGFVNAVRELEHAGAQAFIIDLRNNYGGVIQEAMLTASTLLRDPHAVLCYTMNVRGGFTPHDVQEYVVDTRYPGYMLSKEPSTATLDQVRRERPEWFNNGGSSSMWVPPTSFASLHEQSVKRGIHRVSLGAASKASPSRAVAATRSTWDHDASLSSLQVQSFRRQLNAQKKIVLLINEGTASSAEAFAAALHDNGRTVALVGTKTFGKGLIQHTFPMPDGGGLRLTVAEYLTPSLRHVTRVGGAGFDRATGEWVGGGISPDIRCESRQGIPRNVGADLCVGMALDALE